jgi:guanine deaminase
MMKNLYRGEVFYLIASPLDHVEAYRYFEDGGLAVVDGKIVEARRYVPITRIFR